MAPKNLPNHYYNEQKILNLPLIIVHNLFKFSNQDDDLVYIFLSRIKLSDTKATFKALYRERVTKITPLLISPIFVIGNHFII